MVAVKNVSLAEEHLHDHRIVDGDGRRVPVMPASLIIEGMAQTSGILVGSVHRFREKVVLAKIVTVELEAEVLPGHCLRYDATLDRIDASGAATTGTVERLDHRDGAWIMIGRIELMFSHIDQNRTGVAFPEENFVFGENFRVILESAGLAELMDGVSAPPTP